MRHNRKRKRRRSRLGVLFKLLCLAALVAALTFGATVFFQVETIAVTGNSRYTQDEIIAASGVQVGDNLFRMNKKQISQEILHQLPYVESVSILRGLPSTITFQVTEWDAVAQVEVCMPRGRRRRAERKGSPSRPRPRRPGSSVWVASCWSRSLPRTLRPSR